MMMLYEDHEDFLILHAPPFHQRAAAVDVSLQDYRPGGAGLTPTLHLGQESTHSLPSKGTK